MLTVYSASPLGFSPEWRTYREKIKRRLNERLVINLHYRVGITIVVFLLVQAATGLLLGLGTLSSVTGSKWFQILEIIHTNWDPLGSMYRILLGLGKVAQCILGIIIILLSRAHYRKK